MKIFLLILSLIPFIAYQQVSYSVTVTKLMAKADNCDGSIAPLCIGATVQDPTINIWCGDAAGNENTNCWNFENDNNMSFGVWNDILNVQIGSETNVITSYVKIEMSGFESDQLFTSCSSTIGDDEIQDRQLAQQFDLNTLTEGVVNSVQVNIADIYYAELDILWNDLTASVDEKISDNDLKLIPNPSDGWMKIDFNYQTSSNFSVNVVDLMGRSVFKKSHILSNELFYVDIMETGKYFIHIQNEALSFVKSIEIK